MALQRANRPSIQASVSGFQGWLRQSVEHAYFRTHRFWAYGGLLVIGAAGVAAAALSDAKDAGGSLMALAIWTLALGTVLQMAWNHWGGVLRRSGRRFRSLLKALLMTVLAVGLVLVAVLFGPLVVTGLGLPASIALAAGGGLAVLFRSLLKAPTVAGAKVLDQIEGFRMFLETAERDRLEALHPPTVTPAVFERFLPYAMALDCENEWARRFEAETAASGQPIETSDTDGYSPSWYSGSSDWSGIGAFASDLGPSLASATASASASESSSSGSGGGSSGGGGGGGGGGGW
jgi:uncharacterized membrane protein